ncbi:MAG TPA: DegQ family serine endoprotease [Arenibaculum sp.]|nr:DegQ family serine endoprotease [Arenibaculum sp.]
MLRPGSSTMKRPAILFLLVLSLVGLPAGAVPRDASAQQRLVPQSREQVTLSFAPVVREAAPAVVNIYTRKLVRQRPSPLFDDPLFRRFFGDAIPFGMPRERVQNSLGSGVIVDPDGLVVTNHHVIRGSDEITVVLADRREFQARLVQSDERTDLAVLRIDPPGGERLPHLRLGDSDGLEVGDLVLAIGNPFGVGQTVTSGIVSALARTAAGVSDYSFFIQTDAAINPGNSGGALVTMDGSLAGINTAIYSRSGGSMGIGFAIPSNMVRTLVQAVRNGGPLVRPWLGVSGQPVTAEIAASLGLDRPAGMLVNAIAPQSPAGSAGLRIGDVIVGIDGRPIDDPEALRYRVATLAVGSRVTLTVLRAGAKRDVTFIAAPPPEVPPRETTPLAGSHPLSGATVANLSPALAEEIGFEGGADGDAQGVVVLSVARGSFADRIGVQPGDVLVSVNGREIGEVRGLVRLLGRGARGWSIAVRRGDQILTVQVGG